MLVAAAVCPSPPSLHPALAAAAVLEPLRAACDEAVRGLLAGKPDVVIAVGAQHRDEALSTGLGPYGRDVALSAEPLPLSLLLASYLLDRAGWDGLREFECVRADDDADRCLARGATIGADARRVALLVMGDGSARRTQKAPGWIDPDAEPFDEGLARALGDGDAKALSRLDRTTCERLMVGGRAAFQVLAGATEGRSVDATLLFNDAPFGVGYFVALWNLGPGASSSTGA